MSDDKNIFKQKPLLLFQYMMNADFINDIWTTSNLDHPSNNSLKNFPPHTVAPVKIFSLQKYTRCFSTCSGAWEFYHVEYFRA
jgi:hypothetical protein